VLLAHWEVASRQEAAQAGEGGQQKKIGTCPAVSQPHPVPTDEFIPRQELYPWCKSRCFQNGATCLYFIFDREATS